MNLRYWVISLLCLCIPAGMHADLIPDSIWTIHQHDAHHHVEQGDLTIVCQDGNERTFHEGEALVEVVGTIHRGENRGTQPVILNMFYFAEPGQVLTIQHPEI